MSATAKDLATALIELAARCGALTIEPRRDGDGAIIDGACVLLGYYDESPDSIEGDASEIARCLMEMAR